MKLKIFGDWKGAREALNATERFAKKTSAGIKKAFGKLNGVFSKIFTPLGVGLGGLGVSTILTTVVNKFDEIGKKAKGLNVSAEYFQKLDYAARQTKTAITTVEASMARVTRKASMALSGNTMAKTAFDILGISDDELKTLNQQQLFDRVAASINSIGDAATQNRVKYLLFEETFMQMNRFISDYVALGEEAESRGLIISDKTIQSAEALTTAMTNAGSAFMAAVGESGMVEFLNELAQNIEAAAGYERQKNAAGITVTDNRNTLRKIVEDYGKNLFPIAIALEWATGINPVKAIGDRLWGIQETGYAPALTGNTSSPKQADPAVVARQKAAEARAEAQQALGTMTDAESKMLSEAQTASEIYDVIQKITEARTKEKTLSEQRMADLEQELKYQQMIMQGKAREVEIEKALNREAKARGVDVSKLDAETVARITAATGALYDLKNPEKAAKIIAPQASFPTDSLRRIGGLSGVGSMNNAGINYAKRSSETLSKIEAAANAIERKMSSENPEPRFP